MRFPGSPVSASVRGNTRAAMPGLSSFNSKPGWPLLLGCAWSPWEEVLLKSISQLGDTNSVLSGKANLSSGRCGVLFLPLLWESL